MKPFIFGALFTSLLLTACSNATEEEKTDKRQQSNALKDYIKTPLDKAHSVAGAADERTNQLNRALDDK